MQAGGGVGGASMVFEVIDMERADERADGGCLP